MYSKWKASKGFYVQILWKLTPRGRQIPQWYTHPAENSKMAACVSDGAVIAHGRQIPASKEAAPVTPTNSRNQDIQNLSPSQTPFPSPCDSVSEALQKLRNYNIHVNSLSELEGISHENGDHTHDSVLEFLINYVDVHSINFTKFITHTLTLIDFQKALLHSKEQEITKRLGELHVPHPRNSTCSGLHVLQTTGDSTRSSLLHQADSIYRDLQFFCSELREKIRVRWWVDGWWFAGKHPYSLCL